MGIADSTWPIETEDEVEALARECDWDNRKYMTPTDYAIWCARMRKFARLAAVPSPVATSCEFCIDGLQADGLTPCPCCVNEPAVPAKEWRCFHCDEVFTTENDARLHFGMDQCSVPACKIKMGAEKSLLVALRRAETELQDAWAAIHNENTEAAKAYYAQQSRHGEQLRAAEELGFERGIKDSTAHVAALEEQALRDRRLRDEAQHDALLWQHSVAVGDHPSLLVTVWNQRREAIARATAAERELAEHKSAYTLAHGIFWTETKRLTNALTDLCDAYAACNGEDHAAHRMARSVLSRNSPDRTHRHLKTGGLYAVLCEAKMQAADWFVLRPDGNDVSIDMSEVVIYRSLGDGSTWVRPKHEFYDGRFEAVGPALASTGGEHHAE